MLAELASYHQLIAVITLTSRRVADRFWIVHCFL